MEHEPVHRELSHRTVRPRDETVRAGEHHYLPGINRWPERQENHMVPIVAGCVGGGLLLGWILATLAQPRRREHDWRQEGRHWPEQRWQQDGFRRAVDSDETWDLIASDKVEGTAVYDRNGDRLGSVKNFMVGKRSGRVAYAVMSFGGWLGMDESHHALPWSNLTYDTDQGGYVVTLSKDRLRSAPGHMTGQDTTDTSYWRRVKEYWA